MQNVTEVNGYRAVVLLFDRDIAMFRGEFLGLSGGADFYAASEGDRMISLSAYVDFAAKSRASRGKPRLSVNSVDRGANPL